jgi:hypothetical protein
MQLRGNGNDALSRFLNAKAIVKVTLQLDEREREAARDVSNIPSS